jgi:hypothetical protein
MADHAPAPGGHLLESETRFSRSLMWDITRRYYALRGFDAWESGQVPSYVTSNPFIARAYAFVILAYLRDCLAAGAIDPAQPIYLIEAAAGHGRFSFLLLKKLRALLAQSALGQLQLRYLMTDFTESNIQVWQRQPLFQPFLDQGLLRFALFDVERDPAPRLLPGGAPLPPTANPVILIANYLFDSTIQDVFRFQGGQIHECLVSTRSAEPFDPEHDAPERMDQFTCAYTQRPLHAPPYDEPALNQVLDEYRERLGDTTLVFPIGAITALRNLRRLSGGRFLLLSSDKGYTHEDELLDLEEPSIQHHGCISLMVNFHALGRYLAGQGGSMLCTSQRYLTLKTAALLLGPPAPETALCFNELIDGFGPYDFYRLASGGRQDCQRRSLDHILSLLRLSDWDQNVLLDAADDLRDQAGKATSTQKQALRDAMERVWDNFYPMGKDVPFEIARVLLNLGFPREAQRYNRRSLDLFGDHHVTWLNLGVSHHDAEELEEARRCFLRALELSPEYRGARAWLVRIDAALRARRTSP